LKRIHFFAGLVATAFFALPTAAVVGAPTDSVQGPACGNIELTGVAYRQVDSVRKVTGTFGIEFGAASCDRVTYTVYVFTPDGKTELARTSSFGDFELTIAGEHSAVCVYAESVIAGRHVIDRAPDDGCTAFGQPLQLTTGAGATSFR
jgi:hypothetical protein